MYKRGYEMKRLFAIIFAMLLIATMFLSSISVSASEFNCTVDPTSYAVYLENLDTNTVVFDKNADERTYPASLTKMMTYIVVTEKIPDLKNTKIKVTDDMLAGMDPESSVMGLTSYIGQEFSVLDLLYGLMLPSGNDAALVLAHYVGDGVVSNFVELMNSKAGQIGCKNTHFVNPHGLFDENHYSTARDLAIIAKYAATKPYYNEVTGTLNYTPEGMSQPIENTNYMINPKKTDYYYEPVVGGKTGYTSEAGKCLVTTAQKGEYTYLCVALGSPYTYAEDINYAMLESKELYEWAFDNVSYKEVLRADEVVKSLPVAYVLGEKRVNVVPDKAVIALLPNEYDDSLVSATVALPPSVNAPIEKGQTLGTVSVYYDGEFVGKANLISPEAIEADKGSLAAHKASDFIKRNLVLIIIFGCVILFVVVVLIYNHKKNKKKQSRYRYR